MYYAQHNLQLTGMFTKDSDQPTHRRRLIRLRMSVIGQHQAYL